jgi:putative phosphotransacetylase
VNVDVDLNVNVDENANANAYTPLVDSITECVLAELKKQNRQTHYGKGVPVGVSNRHVHLSKRDMQILFGNDYQLQPLKELTQTGEFACKELVTLDTGDRKLEAVRILGPCRDHTQVEISQTDARYLKKNPPVRNSGELRGSESITIIGPKGKVELLEGCILATRHIHLSLTEATEMGITNNQVVSVRLFGDKPGLLEQVYCKVKDSYVFELHLDTDDANAFLVKSGDIAQIIK